LRFVSAAETPKTEPPKTEPPETEPPKTEEAEEETEETSRQLILKACTCIQRRWLRFLAKRCGPLLKLRDKSMNSVDFYTEDAIHEIPLQFFVSFVDASRGYSMDIRSAMSLITYAERVKEPALNPFTRAPLTPVFLRRITLVKKVPKFITAPTSFSVKITDVFCAISDLGYYTNPAWFSDLNANSLKRLYAALVEIWVHRARLSQRDRARICSANPFKYNFRAIDAMNMHDLQRVVLDVCELFVTSAVERSDRQLGAIYVLGCLAMVSRGAALANPGLLDQFL